jgi:hypothetical protein
LGLLGSKYYQNEERSETNHWYTAEKEKTNDTKVIKVTISYAESNGGIFILIAPLGNTNTNTRANILRVICQQYVLRATRQQYNFA